MEDKFIISRLVKRRAARSGEIARNQTKLRQVLINLKKLDDIIRLQTDLDLWIKEYNERRPHTGKYCFGKPAMQTFLDSIPNGQGEDAQLILPSLVGDLSLRKWRVLTDH